MTWKLFVLPFLSVFTSAQPTVTRAGGASLATRAPSPPPLAFDCSQIPKVCENMCWGAFCTQIPGFPLKLYYDKPNGPTTRARRQSAGCGPRPNRCSVNHRPPFPDANHNCDEYPFASTRQADSGGQVNRCVPAPENSMQGNAIATYVKLNCDNKPCNLNVGFTNNAPVRYCDARKDRKNKCIANGKIYKNGKPDVDWQPPKTQSLATSILATSKRDAVPTVEGGLYMTESGMGVFFAIALEPGTAVQHARAKGRGDSNQEGDGWNFANSTALEIKDFEDGEDDYEGPEMELIDDVILYKME